MIVALIPAYNAKHTIAEVIFKTMETTVNIIVYDDGSTDETAYIAEKCGAQVLRGKENRGKGYALRQLFNYAKNYYSELRYNSLVVVTLDADMQHDPRQIPCLVKPIKDGDADVVVGVRRRIPKHRLVPNRLLNFLQDRRLDTQSGFRAYRFDVIRGLELEQDGFAVDSEILFKVAGKYRVTTVQVEQYTDRFSHSKNPVAHFIEVFNFLFLRRPLLNLGLLGVLGFLAGLYEIWHVVSVWSVYRELALGTFLFGLLFILLGAFTFFTGVILHVLEKR